MASIFPSHNGLIYVTFKSVCNRSFHNVIITSREGHGVSNHWQLDCLFNWWFRQITTASSLLTLCGGNQRWYLDSPHKSPVMLKVVPCGDLVMHQRTIHRAVFCVCFVVYICTVFACHLTHLSLENMAAISQTTFSNAFTGMKTLVFWFLFHLGLFLRVQLTIRQHLFR